MLTPRLILYLFIIAFFLLTSGGCTNTTSPDKPTNITPEKTSPLFVSLPSYQTGIHFQNRLDEGLNTNILMYEYFYNGGGVAIGDVNADGKEDIYLTSNMGDNALYLNEGDLRFKEVGNISGAKGRSGPWKTGVSIIDINGDGKLDIYICYSGSLPDDKRANQLFINQGNNEENIPQFEEQAEAYGVNSPAYSNQAYFFDYDKDGDLDMALLNHNPKSLPVLNEVSSRQMMAQDDPLRGVRLFNQQNNRFSDVTQQAGITGSGLSYGLGLGISDVNNDGWPDLYVSNDYTVPDYLYVNNQDGTFTNTLPNSIGHNSHFSMGNDVADINNDGLTDILTLDMLPEDNKRQKLLLAPDNYAKFDLNVRSGFHYQYMRNMLQLNNGDGTFSEIGQLSGISNTDWSWAALFADYNNDGWKDLYITNGYNRDYTNLDFINYMDSYVKAKGRLVREDVVDIIKEMPSSNVVNYMFANNHDLSFSNKTIRWGMNQASNSNGAAYADLDEDGDLDLVVNNINQAAFLYENQSRSLTQNHYLQISLSGEGKNTYGIGTHIQLSCQGKRQMIEQYPGRGYLSSVSPTLHLGLGQCEYIDSLIVDWPSGKRHILTNIPADQRLEINESDATPNKLKSPKPSPYFAQTSFSIQHEDKTNHINDFDRQALLISGLSHVGPVLNKGDVNQDGKEDIFIGGAEGQASSLYLQQSDGSFSRTRQSDFEKDKAFVDTDAHFFDADGDNDLDLYVASGGYHQFKPEDDKLQDRLYLNDGKGTFESSSSSLPAINISTGSIAISDINGDGLEDIFVGGRLIPGNYPELPQSYILTNDGQGNFTDQTTSLCPDLQRIGMVTDAHWVDLDNDQTMELVIVGEWMPITIFKKNGNSWTDQTLTFFSTTYKGMWNRLEVLDVNGDGREDLIAGNIGTNVQFKVSEKEPAELYFKDFDNNGAIDPIFCYYIQGKSYPYITRDELSRQLVSMKARFTSYQSYADASLEDIFSSQELANADKLKMNHQQTSLFIQQADGTFQVSPLPQEAQYSPVYTITSLDANKDGNTDLLLCGNNSHAKLRLGKMDANYGVLLEGDGTGSFQYVPQYLSGFQLKGDVRSSLLIDNWLIFGVNQQGLIAYKGQ